MSPRERNRALPVHRFPRVSGDEPEFETELAQAITFSPRERG